MMLADFSNSDDMIKQFQHEDGHSSNSSPQAYAITKRPFQTALDSASEEPPEKKLRRSTHRRIKCKARGLANSHKSEDAYLEIPHDAPHGLLLSCSDLECSGSGRRFRFCKVCNVAVAKRNFLKRHGHGLLKSATQLKIEVDEICGFAGSSPSTLFECRPCDMDDAKMAPTTSGVFMDYASKPDTSLIRMLRHHRRLSPPNPQPLGVNEQAWLDLLQERPNIEDTTKMADWMGQILQLSGETQADSSTTDTSIGPLLMTTLEIQNVYPCTLSEDFGNSARAPELGPLTAPTFSINTPRVSPCLTPCPSPEIPLVELDLENYDLGSQESGSSSSTISIIGIEPLPLTTRTLQIDMRLVSPCPASCSSTDFSMEELDLDSCFGISHQSSSSTSDSSVSLLTQRRYSSDKVASEIAEFTTYMDAIDMSTVFD